MRPRIAIAGAALLLGVAGCASHHGPSMAVIDRLPIGGAEGAAATGDGGCNAYDGAGESYFLSTGTPVTFTYGDGSTATGRMSAPHVSADGRWCEVSITPASPMSKSQSAKVTVTVLDNGTTPANLVANGVPTQNRYAVAAA